MSPREEDKAKDHSGDNVSRDFGRMNLEEETNEDVTRKALRDWAFQYSTGEIKQEAPKSGQNSVEEPKSEASSPQGQGGQKVQLPDTSLQQPKELDQKPKRRSRHARHTSQHKVEFKDPQESRPELRDSDIPPVPPIPEKYREEWEMQQRKKREGMEENKKVSQRSRTGPANRRLGIHSQPRESQEASISDEAARKEAARRENERRRRAFEAVVLEDQERWDRGKGKEDELNGTRDRAREGQFERADVRLPRSPGMLNLARPVEEREEAEVPEVTTPPRSRLPVALTAQNLRTKGQGFVEAGEPSILNRTLGDMTRTYVEGMAAQSEVAEMEVKYEERGRYREYWRE
jgi:hypothetical protein